MPTQTLLKKVTGKPIPVLKSRISTRQFRLSKDGAEETSTTDLQQWLKRKQSIWQADNQNPFLDKDQLEEVNQVLVAENPQLPDNLVEFSFKDKTYVPVVHEDHNVTLLDVEGTSLHIESQEAKDQLEGFGSVNKNEEIEKCPETIEEEEIESIKEPEEEGGEDEIEDEEAKDVKEEKDDDLLPPESAGKTKKLMNQFNFCERATITYDNALKTTGTQTKPPTRAKFSDYATQWIIYDSYQEDYEMQEREKERSKKDKPPIAISKKEDFTSRRKSITERNDIINTNIAKKGLILERMINQNMFDDILQDFRYYEDPSDEFRNSEGTLLPLWKFHFNGSRKLCVTDIKWNPKYFDLFAVSFGCFDFQKQCTKGYFCLWSLKNPSYPEYISYTESGVMTLDFHPNKPYLIVVGLNDGMVAVYDSRLTNKAPIYQSSHVDNKHYGIVWQVVWGEDLAEGELTFYSVSSDGNVYNWILIQNQLSQTLVISLSIGPDVICSSERNQRKCKGAGTCIALHPTDRSIFLIGTEEGYIYKCSTAYLSMYLFAYEAHHMPVHRLDYNKYSPDIFASCSADWSIKIWEDSREEPLFVFDTVSAVGDVKWSPYSSTVLAAVTLDCKAYVFDLNIDKYKAICVQTIASKKLHKLTRLAFNWKLPILIVGDDKGVSQVLKLSPNLRIKPKITKKQQSIDPKDLEIMKLEKLLSLIREPTELSKTNVVQSSDTSSL